MKYFSTFTGGGGFEIALDSLDFECVGMSEIDKHASAVLKHHYPNTPNYGDITKIDWDKVPDFDLLVGGSPCQDVSVAGKRSGIEGARSGLFFQYVRALKEKKPAYFIFENVKGLLSSNGGRDFAVVLNEMAEAGYSLWWQVLNAKSFNIPQNRERIFIVGTRNGSPREVFFERAGDTKDLIEITKNAPDAQRVFDPEGIGRTLKGLGGGQGAKTTLIQRQPLRFLDRNQKNIEGDYAFTVDTTNTGGVRIDDRIRRLTPLEAERLMSWPDNHTKYGINEKGEKYLLNDGARYKLCGNGVVSLVVRTLIVTHFL